MTKTIAAKSNTAEQRAFNHPRFKCAKKPGVESIHTTGTY